MTTEEIKSAAMLLGPIERERLAEELFLSVSGDERDALGTGTERLAWA